MQYNDLNWLPTGSDNTFVFSGRTAIETVLRDIGNQAQKALLPSYCCESMIEPFYKTGIEVAFYPVDRKANLIIIDDAVHIQKVILQGDLMVENGKLL